MGIAGFLLLDPFDAVDSIVRGRKEILDYDLMAAMSNNKEDRLVEGCTTATLIIYLDINTYI